MKPISVLSLAVLAMTTGVACVTTGTHEAAIAAERERQAALQAQLDDTAQKLAKTEKAREDLASKTVELEGQVKKLDDELASAVSQNQTLISKVSAMGQNVEKLLGEKDTLAAQREKLNAEVEELRRMRAAAEARSKEYKQLIDKLAKMIDAGSLQVKIRNGLMVVAMSSDVLFPPGRATLKPEAQEAIEELAVTIAGFTDRKFQVVGHSDATPIKTARFPSNWELTSQRANEVVKVLVGAGFSPEMLSAAGAAEFDPIAPNDTAENMEMNRRVEIIFVPKVDEIPGFDEVLSQK